MCAYCVTKQSSQIVKWNLTGERIIESFNESFNTEIYDCGLKREGIDIHKMRLLPDKSGDVIEDTAKIKITRHYRFAEGGSENKRDASSASPGEKKARYR